MYPFPLSKKRTFVSFNTENENIVYMTQFCPGRPIRIVNTAMLIVGALHEATEESSTENSRLDNDQDVFFWKQTEKKGPHISHAHFPTFPQRLLRATNREVKIKKSVQSIIARLSNLKSLELKIIRSKQGYYFSGPQHGFPPPYLCEAFLMWGEMQ